MSPSGSSTLRELFLEAAEIGEPQARAAFLSEACGKDAALRRRLEALLAADQAAGPVPPPPIAAGTGGAEAPGSVIGRYKLLEKIGEGGCGTVYMAEQEEPVRRRVALKIIKLGMDTRSVVARFEAERQALALMDHPNIAKVHDAGATESGRPYFVMELVRGTKITEYCDQENLSTQERLELFVQVCQAIQHAHQKGIIHRDIKPSNILVTINDGVALPKVIDFGIAKATTAQRLTDKTVFTAFEQFIGTPAYMSPEQADLTSLDIDTRSDIYSLGVLLYELLTGKPPFDSKELLQAGLDAMRRTICEQEPLRPSTRLSNLSGDELTTTAQRRGLEAPKLLNLLLGDLDWITMKCLEKDRARRYETANGLARDIQRHLANEPVVARPPSAVYRVQKLVRRNQLLFAAVGAVVLALVLGLGLSTWLFFRERAGRQEQARLRQQAQMEKAKAQTEAAKSQQVAQFLKEMLAGVGPSKALGRDTAMLREILDKTAERIGKELTNQPEAQIELLNTLANTYHELGLYPQMEQTAQAEAELAQRALGEQSAPLASALEQLATAQWELGHYEQAQANLRQVLALRRKLFGNDHPEVAGALNSLGLVLCEKGRYGEAETLFREAVGIGRKRLGEHADLASAFSNLGMVLRLEYKLAESEAVRREALDIDRKVWGNEHPDVAASLSDLGTVLQDEGKLVEAEALFREALAMRRKLLGNDHPLVAISLNNLAYTLVRENNLAEVENLYTEAITILRKSFGKDHPHVAKALSGLGSAFEHEDKLPQAEAAYREALAIARKGLGEAHPDVGSHISNLTRVLLAEGSVTAAELLCRDRLVALRGSLAADDPELAGAAAQLAAVEIASSRYTEAEQLAREALTILEKKHPEDAPTANTRGLVGASLLGQQKYAEAEPVLLSAYESMQRCEARSSMEGQRTLKQMLERLVQLYTLTGRTNDAAEWKKKLAGLDLTQTTGVPSIRGSASSSPEKQQTSGTKP